MRGLIPGSCISPARVHKHSRSLFPSQNERGFLLSNVNSGLHNSAIFVPDECVAAWLHPPSTYTGLHSPTYTSHIPRTWTIHPLLHYTIYLPLYLLLFHPTLSTLHSTLRRFTFHPPADQPFSLHLSTIHFPGSPPSSLRPSCPGLAAPKAPAMRLQRYQYCAFAFHFSNLRGHTG